MLKRSASGRRTAAALCSFSLAVVGALMLLPTSCLQPNPESCELKPDQAICKSIVPPTSCTNDNQCTKPLVCDTDVSKVCVQCTKKEAGACTNATPVCGDDDQCRACQLDSECSSEVCDTTSGQCADPATALYVTPNGTGNCSFTAPCGQIAMALSMVTPTLKTIRLLPGSYTERVSIANTTVTIHGEGADLSEATQGEIIHIEGTANVSLLSLRVHSGLGTSGDGIFCTNNGANTPTLNVQHVTLDTNGGLGLDINKCAVTAAQSTISGNTQGGISISAATFDITNCFITGNGSGGSVFGGVKIDSIGANAPAPHRLDFNTITANLGPAGANLGIQCGSVLTPLTFSSDIVYANLVTGSGLEIAGMGCIASYSDVGPDTDAAALAGVGNINMDPAFVDPTHGNFDLMSISPAKDTADPGATLNIDFHGTARPQGPHSDMGADEIKQ